MTDTNDDLGQTLRKVRDLLGKSLKTVAEPADISTAYLNKLERGDVASPSPHVLHRLSGVLGVDYAELMRLAGYVVTEANTRGGNAFAQALSSEDLTEDEAKAVAAYLAIYRSGGRGRPGA